MAAAVASIEMPFEGGLGGGGGGVRPFGGGGGPSLANAARAAGGGAAAFGRCCGNAIASGSATSRCHAGTGGRPRQAGSGLTGDGGAGVAPAARRCSASHFSS